MGLGGGHERQAIGEGPARTREESLDLRQRAALGSWIERGQRAALGYGIERGQRAALGACIERGRR